MMMVSLKHPFDIRNLLLIIIIIFSVEGILTGGGQNISELDGPVEVCVSLQENVTTAVDIQVTFMPQIKSNGTGRTATRKLDTYRGS